MEWQGGIRSEMNTLEGQQASKKMTEKRLREWYGHVRIKEKHISRRMLDVDKPGTK